MEGVNVVIGIFLDNLIGNNQRATLVRSSETVHAETESISKDISNGGSVEGNLTIQEDK